MNEIGKQYLDQVVDSVLAVKAVFEKPLTLEAGHPEVSMCSVFSAYDTSTGKDVPFVHVFSGIQELANAVEVPLIKEIVDQDVYPVHFSFVYRGVMFLQIEKDQDE